MALNKARHNRQQSWLDLRTACSGLCLRRYAILEKVLKPSIYTYLSYIFYFVSYVVMLYISYNFYKGGRDFSSSDLTGVFMYLLAPFGIAAVIALLIRIFRPEAATKMFYTSLTWLSIVGGAINSFAAYLAWWSTTR